MSAHLAAVLRQKSSPNLDVLVLYLRQAEIEGLLLLVRLRGRENSIQKGRVGLILPMMLEGVEIGG
jgi:hypothetical protein